MFLFLLFSDHSNDNNIASCYKDFKSRSSGMDLFKRIGTDRHKFKIQFFLKTLACNAKLKGDVYIKIKRGDHKVTSEKKISLQQNGTCDFGRQILTFEALTLFYDPDKKAYQQKQAEVTAVILTKKGQKKLLGSFEIDVADYANAGKENIQVKKQFGDKIKAVLQYDVFIKCLGEASQTSKSVDKQPERKKQSSLSKFTSFFTGSKQSPQKKEEEDEESPDQAKKKADKNKKQRDGSNPKAIGKEAQRTFKNKYDVSKTKEPQSTNLAKRNQNTTGSERKIADKPKKKKNDSEEDNEGTPEKPSKNLVSIKQKDNFTEVQQSQSDPKKTAISKKKLSTPQHQQQPIYFDQPNMVKKPIEDQQFQSRPNKMKRTQNTTYTKQSNDPPQKSDNTKKINQFQIKDDNSGQIEKLTKDVKDLKDKNNTLEKQNKELKAQNSRLSDQNQALNRKMQAQASRQNDFYKTQRQKPNYGGKGDDQRVRNLQKQKGQLLVKIQKLEQKYKKDFQKYEQKVQQYEEEKTQLEQATKAQIKRLKDQFSQQKDKCDKLMAKYQEKANETKDFKQRQNDLKERLAAAQNSLSELKLKIGDYLNDANQQGNKTVIDVLTLLSQ